MIGEERSGTVPPSKGAIPDWFLRDSLTSNIFHDLVLARWGKNVEGNEPIMKEQAADADAQVFAW